MRHGGVSTDSRALLWWRKPNRRTVVASFFCWSGLHESRALLSVETPPCLIWPPYYTDCIICIPLHSHHVYWSCEASVCAKMHGKGTHRSHFDMFSRLNFRKQRIVFGMCLQSRCCHSTFAGLAARLNACGKLFCLLAFCCVQVLQEPGIPSRQLRTRAKAVKKLGSIFSQVNRPRNSPVVNIMEEFSEVLQASKTICAKKPVF